MALFGLFGKSQKEDLDKGLFKTKESVFKKLSRAVISKSHVDEDVLNNLEERKPERFCPGGGHAQKTEPGE